MSRRAPVKGAPRITWAELPYDFASHWSKAAWRNGWRRVPAGTIPWRCHLAVWMSYAECHQKRPLSAEQIAERGGFGPLEIMALGHRRVLDQWRPA